MRRDSWRPPEARPENTMNYSTLRYEVADGILILTLNRPEQLNAFTTQMADELVHAFERVNDDERVRAVIVTGAGKAFCAGMDLSVPGNVFGLDESQRPTLADMHDRLDDPVIAKQVRDTGGRVTLAIFDCTKPVIAAVNGVAVGIGATMTLAMDIRLSSESARFGFIFGKIAIVHPLPSRLHGRCSIATRHNRIRSRRIESIRWRCSTPASEKERRACSLSERNARRVSNRNYRAICRRSTKSGRVSRDENDRQKNRPALRRP
jgi:hypothetical protein